MKEHNKETIKKAKQWFGGSEAAVDTLIQMGTIKLETIIKMYQEEILDKQILK